MRSVLFLRSHLLLPLFLLLGLINAAQAQAQFSIAACPTSVADANPNTGCKMRSSFSFLAFGSSPVATPAEACVLVADAVTQSTNSPTSCSHVSGTGNCACSQNGNSIGNIPAVTADPSSLEPACPADHTVLAQSTVRILGPGEFEAFVPLCLAPPGTGVILPPVDPPPVAPPPVTPPTQPGPPPVPACTVAPLAVMTDPIALAHEAGKYTPGGDLDHAAADTLAGLSCLRQRTSGKTNGNVFAAAGFRPAQYQAHLKQVWDSWHALANDSRPECKNLADAMRAEWLKHKLIRDPVASTVHAEGRAVDLVRGSDGTIDSAASLCNMFRPDVAGSPTHFQPGRK